MSLFAFASTAEAARVTEVPADRYDTHHIVRTPSAGKTSVTFSASPRALEQDTVVVFEIRSITDRGALERWRCVAINDVSECLGVPVKIRYLDGERKTVMSVAIRPKNEVVTRRRVVASRI